MAAINSVIGLLYDLVRSSWMTASVVMKYFLLALIADMAYRKDLTFQGFDERILKYGKYTVLGIAAVSVPITFLNISYTPLLKFPSQMTAVGVLGYLFWRY